MTDLLATKPGAESAPAVALLAKVRHGCHLATCTRCLNGLLLLILLQQHMVQHRRMHEQAAVCLQVRATPAVSALLE